MKHILASAFLGLILCTAHSADPGDEVEIRLAGQPDAGFAAQRGKAVECSPKHVSKYHVLPGVTDSKLATFEQVGATGFYLRHSRLIVYLHERPKKESGVFDGDVTFKLIHDGDNVRFEASNNPGMFMVVRDDGVVMMARDPDPAKSTFVLKK